MNIIYLENTNFSTNTVCQESLVFGGVDGFLNEMDLHESSESGVNHLKFRGKFQEADAINKNKRMYPKGVLSENVKKLEKTMNEGGLTGELDHPSDSIIHFKDVSHKITKLWWEGNTLMGEGVILNTPCGKILRSLINDGVRIGISSRGVGSGRVDENGILVIGESYKLITFDIVSDPSTYSAFQKKVTGGKNENVENVEKYLTKNETRSIDRVVDKNILLTCVESILKSQVNQIKERLK